MREAGFGGVEPFYAACAWADGSSLIKTTLALTVAGALLTHISSSVRISLPYSRRSCAFLARISRSCRALPLKRCGHPRRLRRNQPRAHAGHRRGYRGPAYLHRRLVRAAGHEHGEESRRARFTGSTRRRIDRG